jgi:osmotically-inducible protein OsmY
MGPLTLSFVGIASLVIAAQAFAFDPITGAISKGISTAMDVRSKDDVKADVEIDAAVAKKLIDQKGGDLKNVSLLVFARHGVLVGFAKNDEVKRMAEGLTKSDKRLRSLRNDIIVGAVAGGMVGNAVLDKKIDLKLTATRGVSSVNMRWKVYGGDVFLMGVAQSKAEATLATKAIKGLDGVKTVHSSLRIGKR